MSPPLGKSRHDWCLCSLASAKVTFKGYPLMPRGVVFHDCWCGLVVSCTGGHLTKRTISRSSHAEIPLRRLIIIQPCLPALSSLSSRPGLYKVSLCFFTSSFLLFFVCLCCVCRFAWGRSSSQSPLNYPWTPSQSPYKFLWLPGRQIVTTEERRRD